MSLNIKDHTHNMIKINYWINGDDKCYTIKRVSVCTYMWMKNVILLHVHNENLKDSFQEGEVFVLTNCVDNLSFSYFHSSFFDEKCLFDINQNKCWRDDDVDDDNDILMREMIN